MSEATEVAHRGKRRCDRFRVRLLSGERQTGLFTRLRDQEIVEAIASTNIDFVVLDVTPSSLSRDDISRIVFAASALDLPILVRLPESPRSAILHAMSCGATGVIVQQVSTAETAQDIASFVRGQAVERTYAGMGRPAKFRSLERDPVRQQLAREFVLMIQIDDASGVRECEGIAAVNGVDAIFIGSLSIDMAMEVERKGMSGLDALGKICQAGKRFDCRLAMHLRSAEKAPEWAEKGVSLFVVSNDFGLLIDGATRAAVSFRAAA